MQDYAGEQLGLKPSPEPALSGGTCRQKEQEPMLREIGNHFSVNNRSVLSNASSTSRLQWLGVE